MEVNYIGTHAVHLLDRRNIAQPYAISAADLPFCQADPTDITHNCPRQYRLPYPNFTNYYIDSDFHGYSHYNAMNVKFDHRAGDLAVTAIYTWANSKDDKSAAAGVGATGSGYQGFMNNHNPGLDYGPSDFNVDHRFVASYIYQLPIGRGKKIAGGVSRKADLLSEAGRLRASLPSRPASRSASGPQMRRVCSIPTSSAATFRPAATFMAISPASSSA